MESVIAILSIVFLCLVCLGLILFLSRYSSEKESVNEKQKKVQVDLKDSLTRLDAAENLTVLEMAYSEEIQRWPKYDDYLELKYNEKKAALEDKQDVFRLEREKQQRTLKKKWLLSFLFVSLISSLPFFLVALQFAAEENFKEIVNAHSDLKLIYDQMAENGHTHHEIFNFYRESNFEGPSTLNLFSFMIASLPMLGALIPTFIGYIIVYKLEKRWILTLNLFLSPFKIIGEFSTNAVLFAGGSFLVGALYFLISCAVYIQFLIYCWRLRKIYKQNKIKKKLLQVSLSAA